MERRNDIDLLKGIAIIAVVFYHVGLLPYGFLGVEIFLVISGYLLIPKLTGQITSGNYKYFPWLFRRLYRIWPITLAASIISLVLGYFLMIPDSYENLAESVVASDFFANNILSAITTKNYWDSANEYKPLMQMWYLGIIAQFYVVFPILLYLLYRCLRKFKAQSWDIISVASLGFLSLIAYLFSETQYTQKFYFLQYRIWEFAIGGIVGLFAAREKGFSHKALSIIALIIIVILLCFDFTPLSKIDNVTIIGASNISDSSWLKMAGTMGTAFVAALILLSGIKIKRGVVCFLGVMSLSIFVWHQVILAFLRYSFIESFSWWQFCLYVLAVPLVGYLSYKFIEGIRLRTRITKAIFYILLLSVTTTAFIIYRHAGVVRDVPELGISLNNPFANRNTEFIDKFYEADKEFVTDKKHVLVIGNSFARDFAGILDQYEGKDSLEISYKFNVEILEDNRLKSADYIFFFGSKSDFPRQKFKVIPRDCKVYGISTKYYGRNFGIFYAKRNDPDYFLQTTAANSVCDSVNNQWSRSWGEDHFIDLMKIVKRPDGTIPVFTDTNKAISFDCRHLTPDGCKYYARLINFKEIFTQK